MTDGMTREHILVAGLRQLLAEYDRPVEPPAPTRVQVPSGGDVGAILATSTAAEVELAAGGEYAGLRISRAVTIIGNGATVHGVGVPAVHVLPSVSGVSLSDLSCTSDWNGAVVQLGNNDELQTFLSEVPSNIRLERVVVPTHRGKRGFEVNARDVMLADCQARDVYTVTGQDSSALGILNTSGGVTVLGGVYEGGSECVLVGGDTLKLQGIAAPDGLLFEGVLFTRPLTWRTDGVKRVVKNVFELKTGHRVVVRNCVLESCWKDGQDGYGVMLTPTRGGSLVDVTFDGCIVRDCGGGFNISGRDANAISNVRTTGIVVQHSTIQISKTVNGGNGWPFLISGGPGTVDLDALIITHDGNAVLYQQGLLMDRLTLTASTFPAGIYGLNIAGGANGSQWAKGVKTLEVSGNRISGAAKGLKAVFPNNEYV